MTDNISDKDKKDWQNFIFGKEKLHSKDSEPKLKKLIKTRSIDLHGYTIEEANNEIADFIFKKYYNDIKKLIIVTGKGLHSQNKNDPYLSKDLSILKYSVPEFIKKNQELMMKIYDIKEADIKDGGDGAFYIFLKKNNLFI